MRDGLILYPGTPDFFQFITYQFLHAGWAHILGNMWFLYLFGNAVNAKMGNVPYLFFYLAGGVFAGIGFSLTEMQNPVLGASGAIAAVTTAYLVLFPRSTVRLFYWFFVFIGRHPGRLDPADRRQDDRLGQHHHRRPADPPRGRPPDRLRGTPVRLRLRVRRRPAHAPGPRPAARLLRHRLALEPLAAAAGVRRGLLAGAPGQAVDRRPGPPARRGLAVGVGPVGRPLPRPAGSTSCGRRSPRPSTSSTWPQPHSTIAELLQLDPHQVLARSNQLDIANQLTAEGDYPLAAETYEKFLERYGNGSTSQHVRFLLGVIYARHLHDYPKAIECLDACRRGLTDANMTRQCDYWLQVARTQAAGDTEQGPAASER